MNLINSEIGFYLDSVLIHSFLSDNERMVKKAESGAVLGLINGVKDYALSQINPNDKLGSVLNILAPAGISAIFTAMDMTWIGRLIGIAMTVFHIDVKGVLSSISGGIRGLIGNGGQTTSTAVHNVVMDAVKSHTPGASEADATSFFESKGFNQKQRDVFFIKEAIKKYELNKEAKISDVMMNLFTNQKMRTSTFLGTLLSWIARLVIAAGGFMIAGDAINKFLGRPNAIDKTYDASKPSSLPSFTSGPSSSSTQTKFKVKSSYRDVVLNSPSNSWIEKMSNDVGSIENLAIRQG